MTADLVVTKLRGSRILGAVRMPNDQAIGLVLDNGLVIDLRRGSLLNDEESAQVVDTARRRLARESAEVHTLEAIVPKRTFMDALEHPCDAGESERDDSRMRRKVRIDNLDKE